MFAVHKTLHTQGPGQRDLCRNPPKASRNPALLDLYKGTCDPRGPVHVRCAQDIAHTHTGLVRGTCAGTRPRPQWDPALLDLYKGTCDPQGPVHVRCARDIAHSSLVKGTCPGTGTPRCWTCVGGLVTRKEDLSVLALHKTLRTGASSKGPAPEPARARSLKGPCIAGPV